MFRIPSLCELFSLFVKSRTVASATKVLSDTARRLEEVMAHHAEQSDTKARKAAVLSQQAVDHGAEAAKAAAVAANLTSLLS